MIGNAPLRDPDPDCLKCKGTGWKDDETHSVERSCFGAPRIGVYVCDCRRQEAFNKAADVLAELIREGR
jgi:hypothetical protein